MSKIEKPAKANTALQLKKDLDQAGKVLQTVTNSLEKIESVLTNAEAAIASERALKEELSSLRSETTTLREAHKNVQNERQKDFASFTDMTLKLAQEYDTRVTQFALNHESKIREYRKHGEAAESNWKEKLDRERGETLRLKDVESKGRRELERQLKRMTEDWQKMEEQFKSNLQHRNSQLVELGNKNKSLLQELTENETILKGRNTDIQKLTGKLAALEAFTPQDIADRCVACWYHMKAGF